MARPAHPWYWPERNAWYVIHNGNRVPLGLHPEGTKPPKKGKRGWTPPQAILDAFHNLMTQGTPRPEEAGDGTLVADVFQEFIRWCRTNRARKTTERYFDFLDDFNKAHQGLRVSQVHTGYVTKWLDRKEGWNTTTRKNAITALQRAFNWGRKNFGLTHNPIRGMEKPEAKTRTGIVAPEEFEKLLKAIPDRRFRDLLIVSYDSGARPFEVKQLEARHCKIDKQRAELPKEEAKGKKHPRTFYFPTERSMEIIRQLCEEHPSGPLFQNRRRKQWTAMAVKCRLQDLDHVLGRRIRHYDLRHSRITDWLVAGTDSHVVAKLAGHRDTKMLDTVYSHVADDYESVPYNNRTAET
jgi:integrase